MNNMFYDGTMLYTFSRYISSARNMEHAIHRSRFFLIPENRQKIYNNPKKHHASELSAPPSTPLPSEKPPPPPLSGCVAPRAAASGACQRVLFTVVRHLCPAEASPLCNTSPPPSIVVFSRQAPAMPNGAQLTKTRTQHT